MPQLGFINRSLSHFQPFDADIPAETVLIPSWKRCCRIGGQYIVGKCRASKNTLLHQRITTIIRLTEAVLNIDVKNSRYSYYKGRKSKITHTVMKTLQPLFNSWSNNNRFPVKLYDSQFNWCTIIHWKRCLRQCVTLQM